MDFLNTNNNVSQMMDMLNQSSGFGSGSLEDTINAFFPLNTPDVPDQFAAQMQQVLANDPLFQNNTSSAPGSNGDLPQAGDFILNSGATQQNADIDLLLAGQSRLIFEMGLLGGASSAKSNGGSNSAAGFFG